MSNLIIKGTPAQSTETRHLSSARVRNPHDTAPLVDAEKLWEERDAEGLSLEEIEKLTEASADEARKRAQGPGTLRAGRLPDIAREALEKAGRI